MLWIYIYIYIYSIKQPQNIIIKVRIKEHKIGKKLNEIYIAFILSVRQLLVQLYLYQEKLFSLLGMNLVYTYLHQLQPPSLV